MRIFVETQNCFKANRGQIFLITYDDYQKNEHTQGNVRINKYYLHKITEQELLIELLIR